MKMNKRTVIARLRELNLTIGRSHLEMGELLCLVNDKEWWLPYGSFRSWVEKELKLNYRKAAALCATARKVKELRLSRKTVTEIGWSKMMAIAPRLRDGQHGVWLDFASRHTTASLMQALRGEGDMDEAARHARLFYLTDDENEELLAELAHYGLLRHGSRNRNKEAALMSLLAMARSARSHRAKKAA